MRRLGGCRCGTKRSHNDIVDAIAHVLSNLLRKVGKDKRFPIGCHGTSIGLMENRATHLKRVGCFNLQTFLASVRDKVVSQSFRVGIHVFGKGVRNAGPQSIW